MPIFVSITLAADTMSLALWFDRNQIAVTRPLSCLEVEIIHSCRLIILRLETSVCPEYQRKNVILQIYRLKQMSVPIFVNTLKTLLLLTCQIPQNIFTCKIGVHHHREIPSVDRIHLELSIRKVR